MSTRSKQLKLGISVLTIGAVAAAIIGVILTAIKLHT